MSSACDVRLADDVLYSEPSISRSKSWYTRAALHSAEKCEFSSGLVRGVRVPLNQGIPLPDGEAETGETDSRPRTHVFTVT